MVEPDASAALLALEGFSVVSSAADDTRARPLRQLYVDDFTCTDERVAHVSWPSIQPRFERRHGGEARTTPKIV